MSEIKQALAKLRTQPGADRITLGVQILQINQAIAQMDNLKGLLLGAQSIEAHEVAGCCETCATLLLHGELGHRCSDDPILCSACAPTYADYKHQIDKLSDTEIAETYPDQTRSELLQPLEDHLAAGGVLEDKLVHPL